MMNALQKALLLSDQGRSDLKSAIAACFLTNLSLWLPVMVTFQVFNELLKPLMGQTVSWNTMWLLLMEGVLAAVVVFLAARNEYQKTYVASYREASSTRLRVAEHLRRLPMSFFNAKDLSDITANMMADCSSMETMLSSTIPPLIANSALTLLTCVFMAFFNWRMALAIFCMMPVSLLIIWAGRKLQIRLFQKQADKKLAASGQMQEYIEGIRIIKSCGLAGARFSALEQSLRQVKQIAAKTELASGVLVQSAGFLLQAGLGISIFVGTVLIANDAIDLLTLLLFFLFSMRVFSPLLAAFSQLTSLLHLGAVTRRMRSLLTTPAMDGAEMVIRNYDIELDHVTFGYQEEAVIKNASLQIPAGSITALVGPSGSGKSTLTKLIARFWDVCTGNIKIGGVDIRTVEPESLMRCMSFVFQDVTLFHDTVLNNIRIGNRSATEEQVIAAAKAAYCDEFIRRLPKGYDTVLGENGCTLSGGERQRISIARALLKNAPIILLDEATASLDPENEVLVQKAIAKLVEDKTVIMIAHRLRTVTDADQIILLEDGCITECGTHEELLHKKGLYEKLYHIQQKSLEWAV